MAAGTGEDESATKSKYVSDFIAARLDEDTVLSARVREVIYSLVTLWDERNYIAFDEETGARMVLGGRGPDIHNDVLLTVAQIWVDHPDWQPAWLVDEEMAHVRQGEP